MSNPFRQLHATMDKFATEHGWDQIHSPKYLAMALTVESAELQECFHQSRVLDDK